MTNVVARRRWTFDETEEGGQDAILNGGALLRGYQYGHDQGSDTYAVERVWTQAPEVVLSMPDSVRDELLAAIGVGLMRA